MWLGSRAYVLPVWNPSFDFGIIEKNGKKKINGKKRKEKKLLKSKWAKKTLKHFIFIFGSIDF